MRTPLTTLHRRLPYVVDQLAQAMATQVLEAVHAMPQAADPAEVAWPFVSMEFHFAGLPPFRARLSLLPVTEAMEPGAMPLPEPAELQDQNHG